MSNKPEFCFVIEGRVVMGSVSKERTKDHKGQLLVYKKGEKIGQPNPRFDFAIAVLKTGEAHWNQRADWGAPLYQFGASQWPRGQAQNKDFFWKISDGDSTELNSNENRMCDREGCPGNWIVNLSSKNAPHTYVRKPDGSYAEIPAEQIKCGDYVLAEVRATSNESSDNPGLYLNHGVVALIGVGKEIVQRADPAQLFAGRAPTLPPGATAPQLLQMPSAFGSPPVGKAPELGAGFPAAPSVPVTTSQPTTTYRSEVPPPPQVPVTPRPSFLTPGAPPAVPAAPSVPLPPPPASVGPQLTAKANGATYAQLIAGGWNDALLREHGLLV